LFVMFTSFDDDDDDLSLIIYTEGQAEHRNLNVLNFNFTE
jgi:hypothetical protein